MDNRLLCRVLQAQVSAGLRADIAVTGVSMLPALREGDTVTLAACPEYEIGDILVYSYEEDGLLIHRLLFQKGGRYYCKGDNAFRLESVGRDQVIGRVTAVNGRPMEPCPERLVMLSLQVSRAFRECGYDVEKTKQTDSYRFYQKTILNNEVIGMIYRKNEAMEYIQADAASLAVFDPQSGDTHFFDETGIDILSCLQEPCGLEELLERLCRIYDASPDEIRVDVEEFLQQTVGKRVVEIL